MQAKEPLLTVPEGMPSWASVLPYALGIGALSPYLWSYFANYAKDDKKETTNMTELESALLRLVILLGSQHEDVQAQVEELREELKLKLEAKDRVIAAKEQLITERDARIADLETKLDAAVAATEKARSDLGEAQAAPRRGRRKA